MTDPVKQPSPKPKPISTGVSFDFTGLRSPETVNFNGSDLGQNYVPATLNDPSGLEAYLNENQGKMSTLANWVAQSAGSAVLGTIESASYLGDWEQIGDVLTGEEKEYDNWLAESMRNAKEGLKETVPLYRSKEGQEVFSPGSRSFWTSNTPDVIGSVVGLMIPGLAAGKAAGGLAKAANLGAKAQRVAALTGTVATSRYAESTMEANNTFQSALQEHKNQGMSDAEAQELAGVAASRTFNTNWLLAIQDLFQYNTLLKGLGSVAKGKAGLSLSEVLLQTASEAGEEGLQYIFSEEAKRGTLAKDYFGQGFWTERLSDYVTSDEFLANSTLGAFGGAVFSGGALGREKLNNTLFSKQADLNLESLAKERANYVNDIGTSKKIDSNIFSTLAFKHLEQGKINQFKETLNEFSKDPTLDSDTKRQLSKQVEDLDFLVDTQAQVKSLPKEVQKKATADYFDLRQSTNLQADLTGKRRQIYADLTKNNELDPSLQQLHEAKLADQALAEVAKTNSKYAIPSMESKAAINTLLSAYTPEQVKELAPKLVTAKDKEIKTLIRNQILNDDHITDLRTEIAKYATPEGIAQARQEQAAKKVNQEAQAILANPASTKEQILQAEANATDPTLKQELAKKHQTLVDGQKQVNQEKVDQILDEETSSIPLPTDISPEVQTPEFEYAEPSPEDYTEIDPESFIEPNPEDITPEVQPTQKGLTKKDVDDLLQRINTETEVTQPATPKEQQDKSNKAREEVKQTTSVPVWKGEVNSKGERLIYTNNETGETGEANQVYALDTNGNILANTPLVAVGDIVTLKVENNFPWTLTAGFKPDLSTTTNQVINVYKEGYDKPIAQLPSTDNPKSTNVATFQVTKKLRDEVIAKGSLTTRVTAKNIGTQRVNPTLNSLEVLESDYTLNESNEWQLLMLPHNPVLGLIDYNGNVVAENVPGMSGMTEQFINRLSNVAANTSKANLTKMRGNPVTFRTAPDGTLRIAALDARNLNEAEVTWLRSNLADLINSNQLPKLNEVLYLQTHGRGVYDTKNNTKIPDIHKLSRRRLHLVNDTDNLSHILIPINSKGQKAWAAISTKNQLTNFLNNQNTEITVFSIFNGQAQRTKVIADPTTLTNLQKKFDNILSSAFRNIPKENLNSEIRYTDPVTNQTYDSYYQYLTQTDTLLTNLPGSTTIGYGKDSSYSYEQAAIYLDPNPSEQRVEVSDNNEITHIDKTPIPSTATEERPKQKKSHEQILKERYSKLKPANYEGHQFKIIGDKELSWFKEHFSTDFLTIAEGVDRFIAANGLPAFGQYYKHLVNVAEFAIEGTIYHEAFHFFLDPANGLITVKRREKILEGTSEEKLAEEFRRYKLSGGKNKPKSTEVRSFFQKLLTFIKRLIGYKSPIERLFSDIDTTYLTPKQIQDILNNESESDPKYKLLPGFVSYEQQKEAVQAFTSEVMRIANIGARKLDVELIDIFKTQEYIDKVFNSVKDSFSKDLERIKNTAEDNWTDEEHLRYLSYLGMGIGTAINEESNNFIGNYEDTKSTAGFPVEGFKSKVLRDLSRYGFNTLLQAGVTNEEGEAYDELEQTGESERIFDLDHTMVNPSSSISQRVRLFLSTIPEPGNQKTIFGTSKFINFKWVDTNLTRKLVDSIDPLQRLIELAKEDELINSVLQNLINEKNKGNTQLFNEVMMKYGNDSYNKDSVIIGYDTKRLTKEEYDPSQPSKTTKREYFAKVVNTDQNSSWKSLSNRWREEALRKKVTDSLGEVNKNKAVSLLKTLNAVKAQKNLTFETTKEKFIDILRELGVVIPNQVWNEIQATEHPFVELKKLMFGTRRPSLEQLLIDYNAGKDPYEGSNLISNLAKSSAVYDNTASNDAYIDEEGNQQYPNNTKSVITEFVNQIHNNPKDILDYYNQDNFYKHKNEFLRLIANNPNSIELKFVSALRVNDSRAKGFEDRTDIDSLLIRFAEYVNNDSNLLKLFVGTPADKTKQPTLTVPKHKADARNFLLTVLNNTLLSEQVRIQRINKFKERKNQFNILPTDIKNLATNNKFVYIPELNSIPNLVESLSAGEISSEEFDQANEAADRVINEFIDNHYRSFLDYLATQDIITLSSTATDIKVENKRIPEGLLKGYSVEGFLQEFFYNDLAWRMEVSKVLQGDLALYSSTDDYFKRQYQLVTPGYKGYTDTPTNLVRAVYKKQYKKLSEEEYKGLTELAGKEIADKYQEANNRNGINKTDAQSLVSVDAYRTIATAIGKWSPKHEKLYQNIWSKGLTIGKAVSGLSTEEAAELKQLASNILLQPLKPFQFNNREITLPDGSIMLIKEQFKDSITPITPELASVHSGYRDLLAYMKANKVDIMSAEDTVKVGLYGTVDDLTQPLAAWQRREVALSDFRFPQIIPDTKKEEVSLSQLAKLILGNVTDKKIINKFNDLWLEKLIDSNSDLLKSLSLTKDLQLSTDKAKRKEQLFKLSVILKQDLESRGLSENYSDVVELLDTTVGTDFTIPLSFPAFGQRFQSAIARLWKKNILRQKQAGYSVVNLADFGVGYSDELKFMATDPETKEVYTEIGLPIDYINDIGLKRVEHILPNGDIMWNKLTNEQKEALQFILYRIPTSNKSSMIAVRVKKITPPQLNNIVIIPGELTVQQGLDFDVDKSQLLKRVLNKDGTIDRAHVDTRLFDLYWEILNSKEMVKEVLTPLSTEMMNAKFLEYADKGLVDVGNAISPFSVEADNKTEIRNKDGKREIGINSRFNTGHSVIQSILDYVRVNTGIDIQGTENYKYNQLGRKLDSSGILISQNLGETQQAALDAAKNPLLAYFNVVSGTMAGFETMLLFGVPLSTVSDFFMQPVIKKWVEFYKQENQNNSKATEKLFSRYPLVKQQYSFIKEGTASKTLSTNLLSNNLTRTVGEDNLLDAKILTEFLKVLDLGNQMTKINNILSLDTLQDIQGVESLQSIVEQKIDATDSQKAISIDERIFDITNTPNEGKRLAGFYHYGIENPLNFLSNFYPSVSNYDLVKGYYAETIGQTRLVSKDTIKKLNQFFDYFLLNHDSTLDAILTKIHPFYNIDPTLDSSDYRKRWSLFKVDHSMWDNINRLVKKYPNLADNTLIKNLQSERTQENKVQLVGVRNTTGDKNKGDITIGWWELLNAQTPDIRALGHDLIKYSIMTSGFTYTTKSFTDLIPIEFFVQSGLGDVWKQVSKNVLRDRDAAVVNFVRHNFKEIDRFPEIGGYWGKGFTSNDLHSYESSGRHIRSFKLSDSYTDRVQIIPRFFRLEADNFVRLYEGNPENPTQFKELQPLGEKYFVELSADGRAISKNPTYKNDFGSANPWKVKPTQEHPLFGESGDNPYISLYLPEDTNSVETVLRDLLETETNPDSKQNIQKLLENVSKINTPILVEELVDQKGVFQYNQDGSSTIKINPSANIDSEAEMRTVLLHEINHAYFVGILANPITDEEKSFVRNIERLRIEAKDRLGDIKGLENKYEFQATLASDPSFRTVLQKNNFWDRLVRLIRNLFGLRDSFDRVLNEGYEVLNKAQTVQRSTEGEFALEEEAKVTPKKELKLLDKIIAGNKERVRALKNTKQYKKAEELEKDVELLTKLAETNKVKAITESLVSITRELSSIGISLEKMDKNPASINPNAILSTQEQLAYYQDILNTFHIALEDYPDYFTNDKDAIKGLVTVVDSNKSTADKYMRQINKLNQLRSAYTIKSSGVAPDQSVEQIYEDLQTAPRDITWWNRWADSASNVYDPAINAIHKMIRHANAASERSLFSFLYNKEVKDISTEYIEDIQYQKDNGEFGVQKLKRSVVFTPTDAITALTNYEKWLGSKKDSIADKFKPVLNTETLKENENGVEFLSPVSKEGKRILSLKPTSTDYPLKQFYETFVLGYLKSQEDLPIHERPGLRIPSISRGLLESVSREKGVKGKLETLGEQFLNDVRRRYDETDFGVVSLNSGQVRFLPTRFTALQNGKDGRLTTREVSLDIANTVTLFIQEAKRREELDKIHADVELILSNIEARNVVKTKRDEELPGLEQFTSRQDKYKLIDAESGLIDSIEGVESNSYKMGKSLVERQMYGKWKKDEGSITVGGKKIDLRKTIDTVLKYTGMKIMFGNFAIPFANFAMGHAAFFKEAIGGQFINAAQWWAGQKLYKEAAVAALKDLGNRTKTTKYGLLFTYFNPLDTNRPVNSLGIDSTYMRTIFTKIIHSDLVNYQLASNVLGAVMSKFNAKDNKGEDVSLYEALNITKDGKVSLASGYTYKDKKSINPEDIDEIRDYTLKLYEYMNGTYNMADKASMNESTVGALLSFMRNWLPAGIATRYQKLRYDPRFKQDVEGHYISALVAFNNIFKPETGFVAKTVQSIKLLTWMGDNNPEALLMSTELNLSEDKKQQLINMRKANIRKTLFELYLVVGFTLALMYGWDDDDNESYGKYLTTRLRRELLTFVNPVTAWDVLRSPTVALNTVEGISKVIYDNYDATGALLTGEDLPMYQSGPNKGEVKLWADALNLTPFGQLNQFDPEVIETKIRLAKTNGR